LSTAGQRNALGEYGERVAAAHLVGAGMVVLDRNWRCDIGELDLVLRDGRVLVACEVKTRSSEEFGNPLEAVTATKAGRLRRLTARWLEEKDLHPVDVRIDLVGVLQDGHGAARVEHVRGVA
jgi:putative endonuclease